MFNIMHKIIKAGVKVKKSNELGIRLKTEAYNANIRLFNQPIYGLCSQVNVKASRRLGF